ncbi:ABC transporter permease [Paraburkholderia sp. RCC_158]|uniref:ABC transporter permease n=1 Tax=Paraburkholderia sp. RCC_158 TaxID=3239220 RepID=UPI003525ABE2
MTQSVSIDKSAAARRAPRARARRLVLDSGWGRSLLQLAAVVAFFAIWEGAARVGWVSNFLVGSPAKIFDALLRDIRSYQLFVDTGYTLFEAILGFVFGTAVGSVCGLALWYSPFVARLIEPFIVAINSVPKIAFAPIVILWFGTGLISKVALAISLTAIVALIAAYEAAKDADPDLQALLVRRQESDDFAGVPVDALSAALCRDRRRLLHEGRARRHQANGGQPERGAVGRAVG